MEAIEFQLNVSKLLDVRYGESSFNKVDEFWTDFKPHGGEKTTAFLANIVKRTPRNEELVEAIRLNYMRAKAIADEYDKKMYQLRNQFEK